MKRLSNRFLGWLSIAAISLTLAFSATLQTGCGHKTLEVGGAYNLSTNQAPELVKFTADSAFLVAYNAVDFIFTQELNNRAMLARLAPKVTPAIDAIRPKAVGIRDQYFVAIDAYTASPTPANLSTVNRIISEIGKLANVAKEVIANQK